MFPNCCCPSVGQAVVQALGARWWLAGGELLAQALQAQIKSAESDNHEALMRRLIREQQRTNMMLGIAVYFGGGLVTGILVVQLFLRWHMGY